MAKQSLALLVGAAVIGTGVGIFLLTKKPPAPPPPGTAQLVTVGDPTIT